MKEQAKYFIILISSNIILFTAVTYLIIQQQGLKSSIESMDFATSDMQSQVDALSGKLEEMENNLSEEISDVEDAVIIWSD